MKTMRRRLFSTLLILFIGFIDMYAYDDDNLYTPYGAVNYSGSAQALHEMATFVYSCMYAVVTIVDAIAVLVGLYSCMVIYIKISQGEQGVSKAVMMLIGAIVFIIASSRFAAGVFGFDVMY